MTPDTVSAVTTSGDWRPTRRSTTSWALYDLANTIFALGVASLYFPQWLTQNGDDLPSWVGRSGSVDLALALAINAAMIVVIVLGPWIGALSDHAGNRRRYLVWLTGLAVLPTFFLATVGIVPSLALFSLALVGFNLGSVVYDALLPDVSTPETIGRVSGIGIGVGYIGSFIAVGIGIVALETVETTVSLDVTVDLERTIGHPTVFRAIAVLFLLFALPTFLFVRERPRKAEEGAAPRLAGSFRRLVKTWRRARMYDGMARFLVGRFFYSDAINTLIGGFLTIYVIEELSFTDAEVQALLAIAITGAIIGGLVGGHIVDRAGPRVLLNATLHTWMVAILLGIVAGASDVKALAWPLGVLGGLALGATWAADRVYMQVLSPPRYLGEFYGLYATVGRFATVLGPLVWGLVVAVAGLPREAALAALIGFLVVARVILAGVHDRPREWSDAERVQPV